MSFTGFKSIIEEGDTVILYVGVSQIYALKVQPTVLNRHGVPVEYTFQTKYGALKVMNLVGKVYGSKVSLTKGYAYVLYPSAELWTMTLPHRTQILYSTDISMVLMELDIRCGSVVCEAGTGSGSLSHAILRAIGPTGHLYTCDFHQERVEIAKKEFEAHGYGSRVTVTRKDVCSNGWELKEVADAVFLDLPKPWEALPHALAAIKKRGGRICSFSPCVEQSFFWPYSPVPLSPSVEIGDVSNSTLLRFKTWDMGGGKFKVNKTSECMRKLGLTDINTIENLHREFQFRTLTLPSVNVKMLPLDQLQWLNNASSNNEESDTKKQKIGRIEEPQNSVILTEKNENSVSINSLALPNSLDDNSKNSVDKETNKDLLESSVEGLPLATNSEIVSTSTSTNNLISKINMEPQEYKFRTGIPLLKMPGHTGYLTFATVSPCLNREFALSNLDNKTLF